MNIGLDYDGTFTEDPEYWNNMIQYGNLHGHTYYLVTSRPEDEYEDIYKSVMIPIDNIHFTSGVAKIPYMESQGIEIDVWIDNEPEYITEDKY